MSMPIEARKRTDRDVIRDLIDLYCLPEDWDEKDGSIAVKGGAKYQFLSDGRLKSIIKEGKSYGPDGKIAYAYRGAK